MRKKHIVFQAMSEFATLALPRPLLITFTNGAQADFVKARKILISNMFYMSHVSCLMSHKYMSFGI